METEQYEEGMIEWMEEEMRRDEEEYQTLQKMLEDDPSLIIWNDEWEN